MDSIASVKSYLFEKGIISDFNLFQKIITKKTWENRDSIFNWAEASSKKVNTIDDYEKSTNHENNTQKKGYLLKKKIEEKYLNLYETKKHIRILIHLPPSNVSPGGNSLFSNMIESLNFIGISTKEYQWCDNLNQILTEFKPTIFLTSDHHSYLNRIDWNSISKYKQKYSLKIGLTASLEEQGNTPLADRLKWAKKTNVDFYYSFQNPQYFNTLEAYKPFLDAGYSIYSIEFGVNPLHYYPLPAPQKDLNYVFLASSNPDKWNRYFRYLPRIFTKYPGFINGPGWRNDNKLPFNPDRDRYIYSRGKIGINLHIDESINYPCELNERTYMLAACGIPQLVDNPKLISTYFNKDCCFIGKTPEEYFELFEYILDNPDEGDKRASESVKQVFMNYTTFHRAESFVLQLSKELNRE
jgi:hypothetical protein